MNAGSRRQHFLYAFQAPLRGACHFGVDPALKRRAIFRCCSATYVWVSETRALRRVGAGNAGAGDRTPVTRLPTLREANVPRGVPAAVATSLPCQAPPAPGG